MMLILESPEPFDLFWYLVNLVPSPDGFPTLHFLVQITHSMNRSKLDIIIADGNDASGQRLVEILFELSWLKHEFLAGLTSYLSPEVIALA